MANKYPSLLRALFFSLFLVAAAAPARAQGKGFFSKIFKKSVPDVPAGTPVDSSEVDDEDPLAAGTSDTLKLSSDALPDLGLDVEKRKKKETETKKKKKVKRNVFFGLKTRKNFTKTGSGERITIELFYTLAEYKEPNPYVRNIHWYDHKSRRITTAAIKDKATAMILHGPYQKIVNGQIVEEGFFHVGAKHGRWEKYKGDFTLMDKTKYVRGFPKEAEISYYDAERTKIKEVIPKEYGVVKGEYYRYYENGQLECEGRYDNGVKVGRWMEYHQYRRQRRKEIQYGKDAFDDFEPVTLREWDEKGNILFDKERGVNNLGNRQETAENAPARGKETKPANAPEGTESPANNNSTTPPATTTGVATPGTNGVTTPGVSTPGVATPGINTTTTDTTTPPATPPVRKFDNRTRPGAPKRRGY